MKQLHIVFSSADELAWAPFVALASLLLLFNDFSVRNFVDSSVCICYECKRALFLNCEGAQEILRSSHNHRRNLPQN